MFGGGARSPKYADAPLRGSAGASTATSSKRKHVSRERNETLVPGRIGLEQVRRVVAPHAIEHSANERLRSAVRRDVLDPLREDHPGDAHQKRHEGPVGFGRLVLRRPKDLHPGVGFPVISPHCLLLLVVVKRGAPPTRFVWEGLYESCTLCRMCPSQSIPCRGVASWSGTLRTYHSNSCALMRPRVRALASSTVIAFERSFVAIEAGIIECQCWFSPKCDSYASDVPRRRISCSSPAPRTLALERAA